MKISVIGAGSWGTALASQLALKHSDVFLWARSSELTETMQQTRQNSAYLPDVFLPEQLICTSDIEQAVSGAELILLTTPSHAIRETAQKICPYVKSDAILVTAAKGLETGTYKRMSQVIAEEIPQAADQVAALSGPNHAEEVGRQQPTASVVAATALHVAEAVQDAFMLPFFRVYTNPDIVGVELGGALKNIIALGAGAAEGLGFGDNTKAALMTRGLAEIARLGLALGANPLTFAGLAGVGDLMVTCTSRHSRNRRAGILLAEGKTAEQIQQQTNMVVEGIRATGAAYELSRTYNIEMPITEQIYQVLYEGKSPKTAVLELMTRGKTHEVEEVALNGVIAFK
jgi:glycerol-3-phosphate dehydrogenase (NAD(P)+)